MRCYLCGAARFEDDLDVHTTENRDGTTITMDTCADSASCFRRAHANAVVARRAAGAKAWKVARRKR